MTTTNANRLERLSRLGAGIACGGIGLFLIYVVWTRQPGLHVPPAVGYLCAAVFLAAGVTLLLQALGAVRAQLVTTFLLVASLGGVGGWIGFGPGSRQCLGGLSSVSFLAGELVCRAVFGTGAIITGLIAVLVLRPLFRRRGSYSQDEQ